MCTPIALKYNCGYARTAIRELTPRQKGRYARDCNKVKRSTEFRNLFSSFKIPSNLFESDGTHPSTFDSNCETVLDFFKQRWNPASKKSEYEMTFSTMKWKSLSAQAKEKHSLSNCVACSKDFPDLQEAFPAGPMFVAPTSTLVHLPEQQCSSRKGVKQLGRKVLGELDQLWCERFDHSLTSSLPAILPRSSLTHKKTKIERKREDRSRKRKIVENINCQLSENITLTVLAEAESLASYNRKRLEMSFEQPETPPKRAKTHSPNEEHHTWSHDNALAMLQNATTDQKINWSATARTLGIPGKNAGQVLKEFAVSHGVDVARLEHRDSPQLPRLRRQKKKLPGGEISMPSVHEITTERDHLIATGELSIGEPCSPYTITKSVVTPEGNVETREVQISGRKIPLRELRSTLLKGQEKYMRLHTDQEISNLNREQIIELMTAANNVVAPEVTLEQLRDDLTTLQRTRTLAIWHDHSTILSTGYILFAVWVVYDPGMFLTEREYAGQTGHAVENLQTIIEQPLIYMIAPSSSSPSDQLALVGDRIECLHELSENLQATNCVPITDRMKFFCGDKPAQQFERGTQIGGNYKCGGCGCKDAMMQDLAHALQCHWRSLADLQSLVLAGKYGNSPGTLKPLDGLKVNELREELEARGKDTSGKLKPEMQDELSSILQGAQRVPTLLVLNPQQPLANLNPSQYEILDCEPLHDLKGHISHLLNEVPHLLSPTLKEECLKIIENTVPKQKVSGARYRVALMTVYLKLRKCEDVDDNIITLLESAVNMSKQSYLPDSHRTPKAILQLYNASWIHHELCCHLIPNPKEQTQQRFFGVYLHDLVVHAPSQYELVSLRSTNCESQERLFSQAKHISLRATNRKPENVLPTILLSMQAKQKTQPHLDTLKQDESMVSSVSAKLPKFKGTRFSKAFLSQRLPSWQAHLERLSPYLQHGGVWWKEEEDSYKFFDSDEECDYRPEGPSLMHFRSATLQDVHARSAKAWKYILDENVTLPTPYIRLYDAQGSYIGRRNYSSLTGNHTLSEPNPDANTATQELSSGTDAVHSLYHDNPPTPYIRATDDTPKDNTTSLDSHPLPPSSGIHSSSHDNGPSLHPSGMRSTPQDSPPSPHSIGMRSSSQDSHPSSHPGSIYIETPPVPHPSKMNAQSEECPPSPYPRHISAMSQDSPPSGHLARSKISLPGSTPLRILSQPFNDPHHDTTPLPGHVQTASQTSDTHLVNHNPSSTLQPVNLLFQTENEQINCMETEEDTVSQVTINNTHDALLDSISVEDTTLRSKAAKLIHKVTGPSKTLTEFDSMRTELKKKKAIKQSWKPTVTEKEEYGKLLAILQTSVLSAKYTLKLSLKRMEIEYHKQYGVFPTDSHHDYAMLRKKLDYTRKLCNLWHTFEM